jgi:hypothetical protein
MGCGSIKTEVTNESSLPLHSPPGAPAPAAGHPSQAGGATAAAAGAGCRGPTPPTAAGGTSRCCCCSWSGCPANAAGASLPSAPAAASPWQNRGSSGGRAHAPPSARAPHAPRHAGCRAIAAAAAAAAWAAAAAAALGGPEGAAAVAALSRAAVRLR